MKTIRLLLVSVLLMVSAISYGQTKKVISDEKNDTSIPNVASFSNVQYLTQDGKIQKDVSRIDYMKAIPLDMTGKTMQFSRKRILTGYEEVTIFRDSNGKFTKITYSNRIMMYDMSLAAEVTKTLKHPNYGDYSINVANSIIEGVFMLKIGDQVGSGRPIYIRGNSKNGILPAGQKMQFGVWDSTDKQFYPFYDKPMSERADGFEIVAQSDSEGTPMTFREFIEYYAEWWISNSMNPEHVRDNILRKYGNYICEENRIEWLPIVSKGYEERVKISIKLPKIIVKESPVGFAPVKIFD